MLKTISYAKVKTYAVDASTLNEILRAGLIPEAWQVERDLRELTRARLRLIERRKSGWFRPENPRYPTGTSNPGI